MTLAHWHKRTTELSQIHKNNKNACKHKHNLTHCSIHPGLHTKSGTHTHTQCSCTWISPHNVPITHTHTQYPALPSQTKWKWGGSRITPPNGLWVLRRLSERGELAALLWRSPTLICLSSCLTHRQAQTLTWEVHTFFHVDSIHTHVHIHTCCCAVSIPVLVHMHERCQCNTWESALWAEVSAAFQLFLHDRYTSVFCGQQCFGFSRFINCFCCRYKQKEENNIWKRQSHTKYNARKKETFAFV